MNGITIDSLVVETTRRCNMRCPHCVRGDARNVDIDPAHIDALLDQTNMIGGLIVSGGEPALNLKALEHIADGLIKRGVLLLSLNFVTNGLICNDKLIGIMKKYKEIIDISCGCGFAPGTYKPEENTHRVKIGVSLDRYHEARDECEENYNKLKTALKGTADVIKKRGGNAPIRLGRAAGLSRAETVFDNRLDRTMQSIEVLDKDHAPTCKRYDNFKLIAPDQRIVCCGLWLGADGTIRNSDLCLTATYEKIDSSPVICTASDDIWTEIFDYNKGRVNCHQIVKEQIGVEVLDPAYQKEMEHRKRLMGQDDANDEMTSQQRREYEYRFNEAVNAGNIFSDDINAYIEKKARQAQVDDYLLDVEALARESYEYHHGSGQLPEYRQPKEKTVLDLEKYVENVKFYIEKPDKTALCKKCGMPIVDRDGNPVFGIAIGHTRAGAYYSCKRCHGISFAYDFKDLGATVERLEQMEKQATGAAQDKSRRCSYCGKVIINTDGRLIHCTDGGNGYVCEYCGSHN